MNIRNHNQVRRDRIGTIFTALEMPEDIIEMVSAVNPGADNPYHGTQHLFTVAIRCYEAGVIYAYSDRDIREMVLAGLFHDFGHPMNPDDDINIRVAVEGWQRLGVPYDVDARSGAVERLIISTRHPHRIPADSREEIMQDADMLQSLEPDADIFYAGLSAELGEEVSYASTQGFLAQQTIHTSWARNLLQLFPETQK